MPTQNVQQLGPRLEVIDRDLWCVTFPFRGIGVRMTVVKLSSGGLFVHSPGPLDSELKSDLARLGPVESIVAPNDFHHLYLTDFAAAYPDARVFATPGVGKKQPKARIDEPLGQTPDPSWAADLDQVALEGMDKVNEVVFFHRPSKSLIVTDLVFNVPRDVPLLARIFTRISGTYGRIGVSRILKRFMVNDAEAFLSSVERLYAWPFSRVIMTHGDIFAGGPQEFKLLFDNY